MGFYRLTDERLQSALVQALQQLLLGHTNCRFR
jgi:hypothetical protein